ncbi:MAG TPA: GtrA family protein [Methanotrichaceae archaeon]|nr:GtrA family protein [Methanotrichaceae archaeon]
MKYCSQVSEAELRRFFKFCSVGISGVAVNISLLWLFTDIVGVNYIISSVLAIEASILSNSILNDRWTFSDSGSSSSTLVRILKMNAVYLVGSAINLAILVLMTETFGVYYLLSDLFGIGCATLFNFFFAKRYVWGGNS